MGNTLRMFYAMNHSSLQVIGLPKTSRIYNELFIVVCLYRIFSVSIIVIHKLFLTVIFFENYTRSSI